MIGAWAVQVADQFPMCQVIGLDLAPVHPNRIPSNCQFVVGDLTEDLATFKEDSMDMVQGR